MQFQNSLSFAQQLDVSDNLKKIRERFIIPAADGNPQVYFLGNSLGLQPVSAKNKIQQVLDDWATLGVESFFHAREPWMDYHEKLVNPLAKIVGALPQEVVVMNQLTVNLHLMLVSFYRPSAQRYKIICEAKAFPSDQYAFETHVKHHASLHSNQKFDPATAIIEVAPRKGEYTLRTEDILAAIEQHGNETALVLFGGINYYTGQFFDLEKIAAAAKKAGAMVGFDLAHAAGNVLLQLHNWEVDFACWCTYKYLNSGPGAVGGAFIHEKHHDKNLPRFAGWWGYDKPTRFRMEKGFKAMPGAEGWQLSTPAMFLFAAHLASLEIFEEAGWENILQKQKQLTAYLWQLLDEINNSNHGRIIEFITPRNEKERGCQLSMLMPERGKEIHSALMQQGFFTDWREPDVIRLAPVPLYNTYEEVWRFADALKAIINKT
jgi:kynureninase